MDEDYQYVGEELALFQRAQNWKQYFRSQISPFLEGQVLEVGAGIGGTTQTLFDSRVSSWTCLEPDRQLADKLQTVVDELTNEQSTELQVVIGTVDDLQERNMNFDTILYIDVLEHIEDDGQELRSAFQSLNPKGRLIVLSPAHQSLFSPFDQAIGHYRRYNREMYSKISPDGLQPVLVRYLDSVGMLASLSNRFLLREKMPTASQIAVWDRWMVPVSKILDPCTGYRLGKSILGIWQHP